MVKQLNTTNFFENNDQFQVYEGVVKGFAAFSKDLKHRYYIKKVWNEEKPVASALMYNPSLANAVMVDDTVGYLMRVVDSHDYGGLEVVNLLTVVNKDPKSKDIDLVFDRTNFRIIERVIEQANIVVLGWGTLIPKKFRALVLPVELRELIIRHAQKMRCLGLSKNGEPLHPDGLKRKGIDPTTVQLITFDVRLLYEHKD
jgi:hypothetical protein